MPVSVTMPRLGESVTEGTVTRWLKQEGERVEADEPLLEVSTDKVDTEIPSPVAGTLLEIKVNEDETVEVGAELAVIGSGDAAGGGGEPESTPSEEAQQSEPAAEPAAEQPKAEPKPEPAKAGSKNDAEPAPQPGASYGTPSAQAETQEAPKVQPSGQQPAKAKVEGNGGQVASESAGYVTPLVRKLAGEHGVDLGSLRGTGVGGRIRKQDVLEAAEKAKAAANASAKPAAVVAPPAAKAAAPAKPSAAASALRGKTEKMTRLRALIAKRMVESLQVSAQLTTVVEIDVTKIAQLRQRAKNDFLATNGVT